MHKLKAMLALVVLLLFSTKASATEISIDLTAGSGDTLILSADSDITMKLYGPGEQIPPSPREYNKDLRAAREVNSDVVGYLNIAGTNIQTPLLQHNGDSSYYLTRNLYGAYAGAYDTSAVTYADSLCLFGADGSLGKNTVIYGHNWTNIQSGGTPARIAYPEDSQFSQLPSFSDFGFAQAHRVFSFQTLEKEHTVVIFSVMYTETWSMTHPEGFYYINPDPSGKEVEEIVETAKRKSEFVYNVSVEPSDQLVTLTTCTRKYGGSPDQRFVVMGRLLRENEDASSFDGSLQINVSKEPPRL